MNQRVLGEYGEHALTCKHIITHGLPVLDQCFQHRREAQYISQEPTNKCVTGASKTQACIDLSVW